jgi:hypothetical protein
MKHLSCYLTLIAIAFISLSPANGQSNATDAALEGYVTDPAGGVISGARVEAKNTATNRELSVLTNDAGYYRFPLLPIGSYDLRVAAPGFKEFRQSGIILNVGRQARADFRLELGAAQESVTVTADVGMIDTGKVAIEGVVPEQAIRSLPIVSRNLFNFNLLGPGVKGMPSSGFGTTQFTFGGLNRSTWSADGLDNTQRRFGRQIRLVIYTPEAIEETQVVASNYSAEFGRAAGGLVNVITRSGSNEYHGSGMFLYRPNATNARPALAVSKPDNEWRTLAGTFGGPIKKDRLFFFAQYEHNPLVLPQPVTIAPANAAALGLRAEDLEPVRFGETFHTAMGKMNFRLNDKNSGFLRYSRFTNDQPFGGGSGLNFRTRSVQFTDRMNGGAGQLASVLSPTILNEFRFGINRRSELRQQQFAPNPNDAFINIQGVANLGNNIGNNNYSIETSTQLVNNLTWNRGRHTFKTGIDFQGTGFDQSLALNRTFLFNGLAAVPGVRPAVTPLEHYLRTLRRETDPATGRLYNYTQLQQDLGDPSVNLGFRFLNFFAQDELRLSQRFTLNFGLRYERIFFPALDQQAPLELSRRLNSDTNNWAPRFGFSWSPFADTRTVVRGGYGLFFDTPNLGLLLNGFAQNGRRIFSFSIPGSDPAAPQFPNFLSTVDPNRAVPPNVTGFAPDFQILYAHQANLQVERELSRNLSLNLQYQGGRFGTLLRDINLGAPIRFLDDGRPVFPAIRPDARFRQINLVESGGNSNYNALDVTLRRRFDNGLLLSVNYSWSKALSDSDFGGTTEGSNTLTNPLNRRFDYGPTATDTRHYAVAYFLYAPRVSVSSFSWLNGFEFASMLFYNSGRPINTSAGVDLNGDTVLNDRPLFRGRNDINGPDFLQWDFRLTRRINFSERYSLELIAESENLTNRFNANCSISGCTGAVVNRDQAADFGRILATRQARVFQFGACFKF